MSALHHTIRDNLDNLRERNHDLANRLQVEILNRDFAERELAEMRVRLSAQKIVIQNLDAQNRQLRQLLQGLKEVSDG